MNKVIIDENTDITDGHISADEPFRLIVTGNFPVTITNKGNLEITKVILTCEECECHVTTKKQPSPDENYL